MRRMCEVLGVKRSGYYAWRRRGPSDRAKADAALTPVIEAAFQQGRGCYGVPGVHAELQAHDYRVGRKRVSRLMRQLGLSGQRPKRWLPTTTQVNAAHPIQPNILARDFTANGAARRVWNESDPHAAMRRKNACLRVERGQ